MSFAFTLTIHCWKLKQCMPIGLFYFWMLNDALHISDTCLCVLCWDKHAVRDGNGRERLAIAQDGNGFSFDVSLRERDGNGFISTGWDWLWFSFPCPYRAGLLTATFPVAASLLCNSLPSDIQSSPSLPVFRQRLKTFLFVSLLLT